MTIFDRGSFAGGHSESLQDALLRVLASLCEAGFVLWLEGFECVGALKCVGILRSAQNDGLRPVELR